MIRVESAQYVANKEIARSEAEVLRKYLSLFRTGCGSCYVRGKREWVAHRLSECPFLRGEIGYVPFLQGGNGFTVPVGYCWQCAMPQASKLLTDNLFLR